MKSINVLDLIGKVANNWGPPIESLSQIPEGATHYSTKEDHFSKFHKLEDGDWYYYIKEIGWEPYDRAEFASVEYQLKINYDYAVEVFKYE